MRAIWSGSISFGLVNIPIKLYSAVESKGMKTRLLHKKRLTPIRYKKWCDGCTEEVASQDIVKAMEIAKGEYVVIDDEELKSLRPEKSSRIEIMEFIAATQIDPIYMNSHYFVGPEDKSAKTFFLFREVLRESAKIAIGKFVMREKEYVCAIEAFKEAMLLTTLNYANEIRDVHDIPGVEATVKISKVEMDLAKQLISKIEVDEFDMRKHQGTFEQELKVLLKKKAKGETVVIEKTAPTTTEENLIEALKSSLK